MSTPQAFPTGIEFPGGPTYQELLGGGEPIAWVRYKVWAADWYTRTLGVIGADAQGYDRLVGVEMSLDGALASLSGAFDAATAQLIVKAEEEIGGDAAHLSPHQFGWRAFKKVADEAGLVSSTRIASLLGDVDLALEGERQEKPLGWLATLRRLRNRAAHHTTLARTWTVEDGAQTVVGISDVPNLEPFEYLKLSCDQVSDLTERMLAVSNLWGDADAQAPLVRTRWTDA